MMHDSAESRAEIQLRTICPALSYREKYFCKHKVDRTVN